MQREAARGLGLRQYRLNMISRNMKGIERFCWMTTAAVLALVVACSGGGPSEDGQSGGLQEGETLFNRNCSVCHGAQGSGTQAGPPLVHPIYEPGHHPDISFRNAVRNGVISHHWEFGHMPPQPGVPEEDVEKIICYIRQLQVAQGIYEGEAC